MQFNAIIMTVTKCQPKDKNPYCRIDYINLDKKVQSDNIKGQIVQTLFAKVEAFDKIPADVLKDPCKINLEMNNNLKAYVTGITTKNGTISLV